MSHTARERPNRKSGAPVSAAGQIFNTVTDTLAAVKKDYKRSDCNKKLLNYLEKVQNCYRQPKTATEAKSAPESHMQNLKALYPDKVRNNPKIRRAIDMRMKYQS